METIGQWHFLSIEQRNNQNSQNPTMEKSTCVFNIRKRRRKMGEKVKRFFNEKEKKRGNTKRERSKAMILFSQGEKGNKRRGSSSDVWRGEGGIYHPRPYWSWGRRSRRGGWIKINANDSVDSRLLKLPTPHLPAVDLVNGLDFFIYLFFLFSSF